MSLSSQRCRHHPLRGVAGRCPECTRFYCRECVTEHHGRVLCQECLGRRVLDGSGPDGRPLLVYALSAALNLLLLTALFYAGGSLLLRLPSAFHELHEDQAEEGP